MKSPAIILGTAALAGALSPARNCSVTSISAFLPKNATVYYAEHYAQGANFTPPADLNYGSTTMAGCIAQANFTLPNNTQHSVGMVLPDDWNGRFMAVGNGEFSGSVGWSAIINTMWYGFASFSTDTGHEGNNGSFGYHNEAALANWGYRALHNAVVNGKKVTRGYYNHDIAYSYYRGCSAAGKQGFKEVQMFPDDFDGVIAGAPAWWMTHQQLWNVDGVVDNILQNPLGCVFRPETLSCGATSNSTCLTQAQITTVKKLFSPWIEANDTYVFPGYTLGTEVGSPSISSTFVTYIQYMLQVGGEWTWEDWNPSLIALSDRLNPGNATADNFDIAPFYQKGRKLIHYHGYADPSIATGSSIYLYNHIEETLKPQDINLDDFYRFFLVPGMEHSDSLTGNVFGVPGFNDPKHDLVLAIMAWVENGTAPAYLIPTKYENDNPADGVEKQRPICPYPQLAQYSGSGDVNEAQNWHCGTLY
ncbi:hypothetical protein ASPACDRAFT_40338 [Aspergillus aculeatus ATCC 16872]|uniref:Carboxylic ester hydrolase n=1 Tax=Aspergillus aculeatus (strain ATCC 16872 / CBS 172.66 / WB 5094) TaxID=690307 RepID=A0A1L9X3J6_ASPA1|nr:uncharacterized protein ASPACDRAFT_40338 [Aspergillus aculeatus ATCC 16872]OJK03023.1 hypothetical protein ASPACDRAFT_40338 [Aspergillus aculeatus ATCC 16872]